ncbi:MAG: tryptophan synthase subunit beta [bacterium]
MKNKKVNMNVNYNKFPDKKGYFGSFGGRFIPETLMQALLDLEENYKKMKANSKFKKEIFYLYKNYVGRPSPLYEAKNFAKYLKGPRVLLKREDLNHTGSHKINNTLGQVLLAKFMGKSRVIAETGAGQHGVATATAAGLLGLKCDVYMGAEDVERQRLNVDRMKLLGARVFEVHSGTKTLKDSINEAFRDWVTNIKDTFYVLGTVMSAHPYPVMVRDFQSVIGRECKKQLPGITNRPPTYLVACVGGGSNAIGLFYPFLNDKNIKIIGVEAGGLGVSTAQHSATLVKGSPGILHGARSYVLQDRFGQIYPSYSIAAGLDYPGVGPEHSFLMDTKRAEYKTATDKDALEGFRILSETEGILPALEPAHALGYLVKNYKRFNKDDIILLCLSGRGDKDVHTVIEKIKL